jgi:hypothetical protein
MKTKLLLSSAAAGAALCALLGSALAQDKAKKEAAPPPPPPEVKKTTDAFVGKWNLDSTIMMPGLKEPAKFKMVWDCKKIALGNGAECSSDVKLPSPLGPFAISCLLGANPEDKAVHMMCITSMGEVHDHKGAWKDDKTIEFEPLKYTDHGKPATETVTFTMSDPKSMVFKSTTKTPDGDMAFEGTGKRK